MKAVIQAGGKGTRLYPITKDKFPKPLAPLGGQPMLEYQIRTLRRQGAEEIAVITGHLGEQIKEYFRSGENWNVHLTYIEEKSPLGSAGALYYLRDWAAGEDFLLLFGDVVFDVNFERMFSFHREKRSLATLFVHPNSHPYDSDLVRLDEYCRVVGMDFKNRNRDEWYDNCVNAGIYILSGEILKQITSPRKLDLERELLLPFIQENKAVYGYRSSEYVKDAGTVDRFHAVERDLLAGRVAQRNLSRPQRCIFLDRDGTLNRYAGLICREEDFMLEAEVCEAVRAINESGYLAVVVTNQPSVARGLCGMEDIRRIHRKMSSLLGGQGAYLDDIIFCPHHPDRGFPEENPIYKVKCTCRKPQTGMIDEMIKKYNIDVKHSYMIGDTTTDILTGINAGLKTVLVRTGEAGQDGKYAVKAEYEAENLREAVRLILKRDGIGCA